MAIDKTKILDALHHKLIVSVQALPGNPLRDTDCIARLAEAAVIGGAAGIRANGVADLTAIRQRVKVPVIAINKLPPDPEKPYITPTLESALEIAGLGEIIAVDATFRPDRKRAERLIKDIHETIDCLVMADTSTFEEGVAAARAGADIVSTTLSGYTPYTVKTHGPDLETVRRLATAIDIPIIAEGRYLTPTDVDAGLAAGAWAVVIGKMITNAMFITRYFVEQSKEIIA